MSATPGEGAGPSTVADFESCGDLSSSVSDMLVVLRDDRPTEVLFLIPGLEGETSELGPLVAAFSGPLSVVAVLQPALDGAGSSAPSVPELASRMLAAVRSRQPAGPYRLGGYSFGALLALEMAQQLRSAGEMVEDLFLIEAVYDERYWPRAIWRRAIIRRAVRQLVRIAGLPPREGYAELRHRSLRLVQRVIRRRSDTAADPLQSGETPYGIRAYAAVSGYRPRHYPGSITLILATSDRHSGCDPAPLWAGLAEHIEVDRIDGDHLTVLHDPENASTIAGLIENRLALSRKESLRRRRRIRGNSISDSSPDW